MPFQECGNPKYEKLVNTELFGPFVIVSSYTDKDVDGLIDILERQTEHLSAGIVIIFV